tara:strand:+ start:1918 stop:2889 length:972 start_codon:yes stop_codon:yes gene_type:complete
VIFAKYYRLTDKPDGLRKKHDGEIALGGGLAVYMSIVFGNILLPIENIGIPIDIFWIFIFSSFILLMGLLDDIKPLPVLFRLIVQVLASFGVIIYTNLYVSNFGDLLGLGDIDLGIFSIPATIFMVVGVCNAFNMLDGMDGLVSVVSLIALATISFISILNFDSFSVFFLPFISLLVFLFFNLGIFGSKWKMFLGDSGSMWIGFTIAWLLILLSQGDQKLFNPVIALYVILLPILDALSTFIIRFRDRKPIFLPDRNHIHHILLDLGISKQFCLLILTFLSLFSICFSLFAIKYKIADFFVFYAFIFTLVFYSLLLRFILKRN